MSIGCSECVCIAIETQRPELLRSLIERPDIAYRDIFWSHLPFALRKRSEEVYGINERTEMVPKLHQIEAETDLSFIGRSNCGHMRCDEELDSPLQFGCEDLDSPSAYILVSVLKMAEWSSSEEFPAVSDAS